MRRQPPKSTQSRSSAASDVYKRQLVDLAHLDSGGADKLPSPQSARGLELRGVAVGAVLSLIHISEPHETVLDLVCRLLLEKNKIDLVSLLATIILYSRLTSLLF